MTFGKAIDTLYNLAVDAANSAEIIGGAISALQEVASDWENFVDADTWKPESARPSAAAVSKLKKIAEQITDAQSPQATSTPYHNLTYV
jgi:hypothetical protein